MSRSGLSWSAVIAGALTAIAATAIMVALRSGIGFSLASPFSSSPSGSTLIITIMGAVWLVFSQGVGFATGGYIAGRLRTNQGRWHSGEVKFCDGANGLVVWAIGVVISMFLLAGAAGKIASAAGTAAAGGAVAVAGAAAGASQPSMDYFSDTLLRTKPQAQTPASAGGAPAGAPAGSALPNGLNSQTQRQQVNSRRSAQTVYPMTTVPT
jgi:hypothetical protein